MCEGLAMNHRYIRQIVVSLFLGVCFFAAPAYAQPVDCVAVKSLEKDRTLMAPPRDVRQCQLRGEDPPVHWRYKDGKSRGTKVGGSGGFSYSAITAPETPPSSRNARASVTRQVIESACTFPPRLSVTFSPSPSVSLRGSCLAFLNGQFQARNEEPPSPGLGATAADACPAETDTTGAYGTRTPITTGGTVATPCGGMLPSSNSELVITNNATHVAVIDSNRFHIKIYARVGAAFQLTQDVPLPSYLCRPVGFGDAMIMERSFDLTPPTAQIITFNAASGSLVIRLRPRDSMPSHFIPPHVGGDPELFLTLPVDGSGLVTVPPDCTDETGLMRQYGATGARQDIRIQPDPTTISECEVTTVGPTAFNDATVLTCRPTATLNAALNRCIDNLTGLDSPAATVADNWVTVCPDSTPPAPPYTGPRTRNAPNLPLATGTCPACTCPQSAGLPPPPTCDPAAFNCDVITIPTTSAACSANGAQSLQFGVLNRPNLHYPEGSSATLRRVVDGSPSASTPAAMAVTVANTRFYTLPQSIFLLEQTAPVITVNEGGTVTLRDGSILIMNPSATITSSNGRFTMTGGGQRVSSGGLQMQSFAPGTTYAPGAALVQYPIRVQVSRSATFPAGLLFPSMPSTPALPAHIRMPAAPLPAV
jgi:hypothetical protein